MSSTVSLASMAKEKKYLVSGFRPESAEYCEKLRKMGFIEGTAVQLAPVEISDPLVFQIRGSRIALRKKEAQQIMVEEY